MLSFSLSKDEKLSHALLSLMFLGELTFIFGNGDLYIDLRENESTILWYKSTAVILFRLF